VYNMVGGWSGWSELSEWANVGLYVGSREGRISEECV
jgi:hypothetical protein